MNTSHSQAKVAKSVTTRAKPTWRRSFAWYSPKFSERSTERLIVSRGRSAAQYERCRNPCTASRSSIDGSVLIT